jgi:hypothetical protein
VQERIRRGLASDVDAEAEDEPPDFLLNASATLLVGQKREHVEQEGPRTKAARAVPLVSSQKLLRPAVVDQQSSLLRRLLDKDIRRERSHLLQAFRFLENRGCAARVRALRITSDFPSSFLSDT